MSFLRLATKIGDVFDTFLSFLALLAAITLASIWFLVCFAVVARYLFQYPMGWIIEVAEYSLLWIGFLGGAWLLRREKHVAMDMVIRPLGPKNQAMINTVTSMLGAVVCLVVAWYAGEVTWKLFRDGVRVASALEPLKAPIVMIVPAGTFLLFIQFLRRGYKYLLLWRA